jgi:hypothetical protein
MCQACIEGDLWAAYQDELAARARAGGAVTTAPASARPSPDASDPTAQQNGPSLVEPKCE